MYRQAPPLSRTKSFLPSPAPEELGDLGTDIKAALDDKRRAIDEAIEAFRTQKEEEFRIFEDELRSRKRRSSRSDIQGWLSPKSGLGILNRTEFCPGAYVVKDNQKKPEDAPSGGLKPMLGPSRPSVSIDRVTINGMTTPPISGTPPPTKRLSRSPTTLPSPLPQDSQLEPSEPPTPIREHNFHGLFAPGYLKLLDSQPASAPQVSTSPPTAPPKLVPAAPALPSNSLPSALRSGSGTVRKGKRVTFRLADSAVVDPSSSYEETPSPSENYDEIELGEAGTDFGNDTPSGQILRKEETEPETDGVLKSPSSQAPEEADFFPFDEELDDSEFDPRKDQEDNEDDALELDDRDPKSEPVDVASPTFASGSLPIDIAQPGSSYRAGLDGKLIRE